MSQPIIRGIQSVGQVDIFYQYNTPDHILTWPKELIKINKADGSANDNMQIDTSGGIQIAGFRLDSEFLRANPQIASSVVIPILGGGGVALTNNNRTGSLNLTCAKVSTPNGDEGSTGGKLGAMYKPSGSMIGPDVDNVFDFVTIAQMQQARAGGDSVGSTICINFEFCGLLTKVQFEGCTIATVDLLGVAGNDAANYNIVVNYLNWRTEYNGTAGFIAV